MKKNFLFGLLALMLAGFGFGGISMAENEVEGCDISISDPTSTSLFVRIIVKCEDSEGVKKNIGNDDYDVTFMDTEEGKMKFSITGKNGYSWVYDKEITKPETDSVIYYSKYVPTQGSQNYVYYFKNPAASDLNMGGIYKLYADTSISNNKSIAGAMNNPNVTIDLNGHNLQAYEGKSLIAISNNNNKGNYSITDTSESKGGKIIVSSSVENAIDVSKGTLNLTIGEGVILEGGKINIPSGKGSLTFNGKSSEDLAESTEEGYYSVYDGEQYYEVKPLTPTEFNMSTNLNIKIPVVLNDQGNGLLLYETIAVLKKVGLTAGDLYTMLTAETTNQELLDQHAKVVEVEGQKLLFFNDGTKIGVFTEEKEGGIFSSRDMFITSSESTKDYVAGTLAVDWDNKVDPFNVSNGTIDKYHEIEKEGDVIGYTFHINDGKWFYAPKRELTTVNFQMSVNKDAQNEGNPITFPVVLNEAGNGLILEDTIIALNQANMTVGDLYAALTNPATTQDKLDEAAIVVEVEGQKLLFFNDGSKIGVFTQELDGGIFSSRDMFITSSESTKDYVAGTLAVDWDNKVDPFNVFNGTIDKYHEISKDGKVIGYTFHVQNNKWFYAPAAYTVTFVDVDGSTVLKAAAPYAYGTEKTAIVLPETLPTKAADNTCNTYELSWTPALADVTETVTYKATFTCTSKKSSSGGSSSGGGGSRKTTTTDDAKATTGDTAKVDEQKADDSKSDESKADESKTSEEAKAAADAQALKDGYSQEFIDAYNFAYKNGITTMPTINEAQMDQPLTRIAMAKMLSQYAINVLGKTPDTTIEVPNFPDVSEELDAQYNNGVTLVYQLGIMGINVEKFRPDDLVTRAEFGTALSRMLYGTADGEGNEWYSTHLEKLMNEKIITNDNPQLQELRGYVMIMLMRSAQ